MQSCPECNERVETAANKEKVCTGCGFVVDDICIEYGPEWRAYDALERTLELNGYEQGIDPCRPHLGQDSILIGGEA